MNLFLSALYRLLKAIVVFTLRIFYPHTAFIDRHFLHHKGPAILIVNHPNTLLDALFGALSSPRYTFFLANYSLFKNPVAGWLLNQLYCIPIQRYQDTNGRPLQNEDSFARADAHLAAGGQLLVAPEGASLPGRRVRTFKTGAARIAFSMASKSGFQSGLVFLPVGLTYERPHRFGGSVTVQAGPPIAVDDFADAWAADPVQAVRELTQYLELKMQQLVVHTTDEAEDKLLHYAEILLRNSRPLPQKEEYLRTRRLLNGFRRLQQTDAPGWERFSRDVRAYFFRLHALGLQDHAVAAPYLRFVWGHIAALWLTLPVFVLGWALNALPFHLPGFIADRAGAVPEYKATWKYVGGLLFFTIWYVILYQLFRTQLSALWSWGLLLLTPALGWAAWRYYQWALHTWQSWKAWDVFRKKPALRQEWQEFRAALLRETEGMVRTTL